MNKNYTISSLSALKELPELNIAQFTLNSRLGPSKRKTVAAIQQLRETGINTKLIIHWDYIYIPTRYKYLCSSVKQAIIDELVGILTYAEHDKNLLGIIMHTDYPFKKGIYSDKREKILDSYNTGFWNYNVIKEMTEEQDPVYESLIEFAKDLIFAYNKPFPIKVYLENTTKNGGSDYGTIFHLTGFLNSHHELVNSFGACYDMEHEYAATGHRLSIADLEFIKKEICDLIVHVNTIPPEVQPGNKKDRHSETTIFECSYAPYDYYIHYTYQLDNLGIPWVREVHTETMYREINDSRFNI